MRSNYDIDLFKKIFLGKFDERLMGDITKKGSGVLGFLKYLLGDSPAFYEGDQTGHYSLEVFEEDGHTSCMIKNGNTLYYLAEGVAVEMTPGGAFNQINLTSALGNVSKCSLIPTEKGIKIMGQEIKTHNGQYYDYSTEFETTIPCDARDVLEKIRLGEPFTPDKLVKFVQDNINQAKIASTDYASRFFISTPSEGISIVEGSMIKRTNRYTYNIHPLSTASGSEHSKTELGESYEEAINNLQETYLDDKFKQSSAMFKLFAQIDPRIINMTKQLNTNQQNLLGDDLQKLLTTTHRVDHTKKSEF